MLPKPRVARVAIILGLPLCVPRGPLIQWTPLCFSGTSSSGLAGQVEGMGKAKDKTTCPRPGPMPKAVLPGTRRVWPERPPAQPVLAAVEDFDLGEILMGLGEAEMTESLFLTLDL